MGQIKSAECDIYLGKNAGEQLLRDIAKARKSVKIVSPYLSESLVKGLIRLKQKGIQVALVTSDALEDAENEAFKILYGMIEQEEHRDASAARRRQFLMVLATLLGLVSLVFFLIILNQGISKTFSHNLSRIVICLITAVAAVWLGLAVSNMPIYRYSYKTVIPFRIFQTKYNSGNQNGTLVHSKMYLVDDEIAHISSFNFTNAGLRKNFESSVRTTDPEAVEMLVTEFRDLFKNSKMPTTNISTLGKRLYRERIN